MNSLMFIFNLDKKRNSMLQNTNSRKFSKYGPQKSLTLLWGATGEQEWTPALTTGITATIL